MTCVVGLIDNGIIHMAADSLGSGSYIKTERKDPKLFTMNNKAIVGFTTSYRMGQVLMYSDLLKHQKNITHQWMVTEFIPRVQKLFAEAGIEKNENGVKACGSFLIGVHGKLFLIDSDYQVEESKDNYNVVGSGNEAAAGALYATKSMKDPYKRVKIAVEAAIKHINGCGGNVLYGNTKDLIIHK